VRALALAALFALALQAGAQGPVAALPSFKDLMKDQGPAVVNIISISKPSAAAGGDAPGGGEGLGSGFIISENGYILTNAHLVADAAEVIVRLADAKREFRASVVGVDRRSDVALVKVDASGLPTARLGDSARLEPGDWVAAIGSPFGFANTITAGIVSAKGRSLPDELYVPFIQTDVALNPGNSGGPLLNLRGEVVGMNSLIYSGTGGYMGVSFAIPIEVAMAVSRELKSRGKVTRGRAGIAVQPLTPELARSFHVDPASGAIIVRLEPGGPAQRAGMRVGDVMLEWNGEPVADPGALPRLVAAMAPGSVARVTLSRGGERHTVALTIGEMPEEKPARAEPQPVPDQAHETLGMALQELTPRERRALGVDYGLKVLEVSAAPAARSALAAGDVIVGVGEQRIRSREQFDRLLAAQPKEEPLALLVRRGEAALYVALELAGSG
jgi:serine protease Do